MAYQQYQDVYSIILLGDASVGKTCIIQNFSKGNSSLLAYRPTLGIDYVSKNIEISSSHTVKAQIWDTAGQENYRSITIDYMRKGQGAIVVFDVTNKKTFNSVNYWVEMLKEKATENVQIFLVGNKIDKAGSRVVSSAEAEDLARQYGIGYFEVTATDVTVLGDLFRNMCQSMLMVYGRDRAGQKWRGSQGAGSNEIRGKYGSLPTVTEKRMLLRALFDGFIQLNEDVQRVCLDRP